MPQRNHIPICYNTRWSYFDGVNAFQKKWSSKLLLRCYQKWLEGNNPFTHMAKLAALVSLDPNETQRKLKYEVDNFVLSVPYLRTYLLTY